MEVRRDRRYLAHRVAGRKPAAYMLSPIDAPRPAVGSVETEAQCRACRRTVRCVLENPSAFRWRMLRRLLAVWGGVVVAPFVAAIWWAATFAQIDESMIVSLSLLVGCPCLTVAFLCTVVLLAEASYGDGVRLVHRSKRHSIKALGGLTPVGNDTWIVYRDPTFRDAPF